MKERRRSLLEQQYSTIALWYPCTKLCCRYGAGGGARNLIHVELYKVYTEIVPPVILVLQCTGVVNYHQCTYLCMYVLLYVYCRSYRYLLLLYIAVTNKRQKRLTRRSASLQRTRNYELPLASLEINCISRSQSQAS